MLDFSQCMWFWKAADHNAIVNNRHLKQGPHCWGGWNDTGGINSLCFWGSAARRMWMIITKMTKLEICPQSQGCSESNYQCYLHIPYIHNVKCKTCFMLIYPLFVIFLYFYLWWLYAPQNRLTKSEHITNNKYSLSSILDKVKLGFKFTNLDGKLQMQISML